MTEQLHSLSLCVISIINFLMKYLMIDMTEYANQLLAIEFYIIVKGMSHFPN